jgi:hypothetical protein
VDLAWVDLAWVDEVFGITLGVLLLWECSIIALYPNNYFGDTHMTLGTNWIY